MDEIKVEDVTLENVNKSSFVCLNEANQPEGDVRKGCLQKQRWLEKELKKGKLASKMALKGNNAVGIINFKHDTDQKVIEIYCIWVPKKDFWREHIATKLLESVIEYAKTPIKSFNIEPALAITVLPFDGAMPGQQKAYDFYKRRGFLETPENSHYLYLPIKEGFIYQPPTALTKVYIPQEEDKGKLVIIDEPSFCPLNYFIGRKIETLVKMIEPKIEVLWIDKFEQPDEAKKRGDVSGGIIYGHHIQTFVFDEEEFNKEVKEVLWRLKAQ